MYLLILASIRMIRERSWLSPHQDGCATNVHRVGKGHDGSKQVVHPHRAIFIHHHPNENILLFFLPYLCSRLSTCNRRLRGSPIARWRTFTSGFVYPSPVSHCFRRCSTRSSLAAPSPCCSSSSFLDSQNVIPHPRTSPACRHSDASPVDEHVCRACNASLGYSRQRPWDTGNPTPIC
jgi:hypothetical protein